MQATVKSFYDDDTGELVAQKFYLGNEEVSVEDYLDFTEPIDEEEFDDEECDGDCENCEYGYEEETLDDVIADYVELIQDANGCPACIEALLNNFADELLDFVEEIDDEE